MLSFYDAAWIAAAPSLVSNPALRQLLSDRVRQWRDVGVLGMTHLLIVEPGDTEHAIVGEIGISPLVNPIDQVRFGADGFHPFWDGLLAHPGWFELIVCVGDGGFAFVLFIPDNEKIDNDLLTLCRTYTEGAK